MTKSLPSTLLLFFVLSLIIIGCLPDDESFTGDTSVRLTFSVDSVIFDTLISSRESITQRLRVFNPSSGAIRLDNIALSQQNTPYSLTINGIEGTDFDNVSVIGRDSLLILVKANIPFSNLDKPYLVEDDLLFSYHGVTDQVKVVAWGRDARSVPATVLPCDTRWTAGMPYIIEDLIIVDSLCKLTIEAGATVLMGNNAAIFVQGSLTVEGTSSAPVVISSLRQDGAFENTPGQWEAIYFLEGSTNNLIQHARISNGSIGFRVGTPDEDDVYDLVVANSIISNMSIAGILAFTSDVYAVNTQIDNCRTYLIGNFAGGNYAYEHCTFTNSPTDFFRQEPSLQFSDVLFIEDGEALSAPLDVRLVNNIIWGTENEELFFSNDGNEPFFLDLRHNIIRSSNTEFAISGNLLSQERSFPGFKAALAKNFALDSLSNARNAGTNIGILTDLLGNERDSIPDIGAYEWRPQQKD